MNIPPEVRTKFYALRAVALVLMLCAPTIFILRPHDFGFRLLAILAIFPGLAIVKLSDNVARRALGQVLPNRSFEGSFAKRLYRVGPLAWTLTALSLAACVVCYFLLYVGGREVWPVYAFFVAAVALTLTAGYVVATMSSRWFR